MALLKCPECRKAVSSRAVACPHCGFQRGTPQEPTLNLKTGTHGYCPDCNHPYIVQADMSGSDYYVCEKCGARKPVNELATAINWGCLTAVLIGAFMVMWMISWLYNKLF